MGFTINQFSWSSPASAVGTEDKPEPVLYGSQVRCPGRPGGPDLWLSSILKAASREGAALQRLRVPARPLCTSQTQGGVGRTPVQKEKKFERMGGGGVAYFLKKDPEQRQFDYCWV